MNRLRVAGIHFLSSLLVACLAYWLIFHIWYPDKLSALAGGAELFVLLFGIDVVIGPALTAVIASPNKRWAELRRDLGIIVFLQLAALSYGVYSIALARPVFLAFEIDRIRILSAADVDGFALAAAPPALRTLPWTGPRQISVVKPIGAQAQIRSIEKGLAGIDLWMDPSNWREFETSRSAAWAAARPVALLQTRYPSVVDELNVISSKSGHEVASLRFLPVQARHGEGVALIAPPGSTIVGYLLVDGFF